MPVPDAYRLKQPRGLSARRKGLPLPARVVLVVAVVALGGAVYVTATGGIGSLVRALGTSLSGFVDELTATPTPSSTPIIVADAPIITLPPEPYTNQPRADLEVIVPDEYVGDPQVRVRIYLTLEGVPATPIAEAPVGSTIRLIVPVDLTPGRNAFSATIVEAGIESESSPIVTFILDTEAPTFVLASPQDGQTVNRETVAITGTTEPRTRILARNAANGTSISGLAADNGAFTVELPLEPGPNGIRLSGTDPAGNPGELIFSVIRGSGQLTATLTASAYRISVGSLPVSLQLSVLVTNPDGIPLEGATVTFSLTVPGIPPVAKEAVTGGDGRATFTTTLPTGVTTGSGLATVLVATDDFGSTSTQKTITIVK
ncbi:MAG: Ig-like domain-containing protein [Chloroflexota bacterium]